MKRSLSCLSDFAEADVEGVLFLAAFISGGGTFSNEGCDRDALAGFSFGMPIPFVP